MRGKAVWTFRNGGSLPAHQQVAGRNVIKQNMWRETDTVRGAERVRETGTVS